jgi:phosphinothricin acetyltransferase
MRPEFREATEADLEQIVATYNSTIPSRLVTADLEPVTVESRRDWFIAHQAGNRPLWVLEADGKYAGWMSFNTFYPRAAYDGTAELSIYLEESYRGKGLGKLCVAKAIEEAPRKRIHTLLGFIFGHNQVSLKLFYDCGFEKWAHFPGVANMDGQMRDLLILGKKVKEN